MKPNDAGTLRWGTIIKILFRQSFDKVGDRYKVNITKVRQTGI